MPVAAGLVTAADHHDEDHAMHGRQPVREGLEPWREPPLLEAIVGRWSCPDRAACHAASGVEVRRALLPWSVLPSSPARAPVPVAVGPSQSESFSAGSERSPAVRREPLGIAPAAERGESCHSPDRLAWGVTPSVIAPGCLAVPCGPRPSAGRAAVHATRNPTGSETPPAESHEPASA